MTGQTNMMLDILKGKDIFQAKLVQELQIGWVLSLKLQALFLH